jgi:hypothetical protein
LERQRRQQEEDPDEYQLLELQERHDEQARQEQQELEDVQILMQIEQEQKTLEQQILKKQRLEKQQKLQQAQLRRRNAKSLEQQQQMHHHQRNLTPTLVVTSVDLTTPPPSQDFFDQESDQEPKKSFIARERRKNPVGQEFLDANGDAIENMDIVPETASPANSDSRFISNSPESMDFAPVATPAATQGVDGVSLNPRPVSRICDFALSRRNKAFTHMIRGFVASNPRIKANDDGTVTIKASVDDGSRMSELLVLPMQESLKNNFSRAATGRIYTAKDFNEISIKERKAWNKQMRPVIRGAVGFFHISRKITSSSMSLVEYSEEPPKGLCDFVNQFQAYVDTRLHDYLSRL